MRARESREEDRRPRRRDTGSNWLVPTSSQPVPQRTSWPHRGDLNPGSGPGGRAAKSAPFKIALEFLRRTRLSKAREALVDAVRVDRLEHHVGPPLGRRRLEQRDEGHADVVWVLLAEGQAGSSVDIPARNGQTPRFKALPLPCPRCARIVVNAPSLPLCVCVSLSLS